MKHKHDFHNWAMIEGNLISHCSVIGCNKKAKVKHGGWHDDM